jgi:hypothetical protein
LWKHDVASYKEVGLNTVELIERLRQRLAQQGRIKEDGGG